MQCVFTSSGTHAVKNRSQYGGGRVMETKGTGRARQGSIHHHNGLVGYRIWSNTRSCCAYKSIKKVRRLALQSVLSQKVLEGVSSC